MNLALCMARQQAQCLLVDYSMTAGDFFMMLDQVPRHTLYDAYSQGSGVDEILMRNLVSPHPLGFNYLACPNDEFDIYGFDYETAKSLLQVGRALSPYLIVDTGAFDLPPTNAAVDVADLVYLLTTRDLARLMSLKRLIKSYVNRGLDAERLKVIVNNAEVGTEISEEEIEDFIEHPVTAYLPSVPVQTTFSINTGKPLAHARPEEPLVSVINRLAEISVQKWAG
jgi:pilus assembly protein CpaE